MQAIKVEESFRDNQMETNILYDQEKIYEEGYKSEFEGNNRLGESVGIVRRNWLKRNGNKG